MYTFIFVSLWQTCLGIRTGVGLRLATKNSCCCREGRCDQNQHSHDEAWSHLRAIEPNFEGGSLFCCIRSGLACSRLTRNGTFWSHFGSRPWFLKDDVHCENKQEKAIRETIEKNPDESCQRQLKAFTGLIAEKMTESKDRMLHGTEIHDIHNAQAAETISHQILVNAEQFHETTTGASLFWHPQPVKLLWNRIERKPRRAWKLKLNAGELSRDDDTIFGQIVEDSRVNHLKSCEYDSVIAVKNVWRTSSLSYAGLSREKPLVILVGVSSLADLEQTMLWKAELYGVAGNPPEKTVDVVSIGGIGCEKLSRILKEKIEDEATKNPSLLVIRDKWTNIESFACREADRYKPDVKIGDVYMPPFGEYRFGIGYWSSLANKGGGEVFRRNYSKSDCIRVLLMLEPSLCHHLDAFKSVVQFESDDSALQELAPKCGNPQEISLRGTQVTDAGLKEVVQNFGKLTTINLGSTEVTDAGVEDLAQSCPRLHTIYLGCTKVTDDVSKEFGQIFGWTSGAGDPKHCLYRPRGFQGLERGEQLLIMIIADTHAELEETTFWKDDLQDAARSPPQRSISVISFGVFGCKELMKILKVKIELEVRTAPLSKRLMEKWPELAFECRLAKLNETSPTRTDKYPPPFSDFNFEVIDGKSPRCHSWCDECEIAIEPKRGTRKTRLGRWASICYASVDNVPRLRQESGECRSDSRYLPLAVNKKNKVAYICQDLGLLDVKPNKTTQNWKEHVK